jgi:RNase P subunit RPR2
MLACLSPLKAHAEESLNTLHFASMALRIKSQPLIMMDPQVQRCACNTCCTLFYTYSTQVV